MSKRKKSKNGRLFPSFPLPHINLELPEQTQRFISGIVFLTIGIIFAFSFFDGAGKAGELMKAFLQHSFGMVAFLLPIVFLSGGILFLRSKVEYNKKALVFSLALFTVAISGLVASFGFDNGGEQVREVAGWVGFLSAWPLLVVFGPWVPIIIFFALIFVSFAIFWQYLPREQKEEAEELTQATQERIRKIFEPKFDVKEIEPRSYMQEEDEDEEEEQEKKKTKAPAPKERKKEAAPISLAEMTGDFPLPPVGLLEWEKGSPNAGDVKAYSVVIKKTLQNFGIDVEMAEVNIGPAVTQYAFKPAEGIKLSRITALQQDLSLALAAHPIRIEAPIPGRALVGIELPNKARTVVRLRSLIEHTQFQESESPLLLALGKDVSGNPIYGDLAKMPHLLVAGATGAGKTIGLNNIIVSLLYRNSPEVLRFILVDPKRVEFPAYNDLPHLLTPVITDTQRTVNTLKWLLKEMDRRFIVMANVKTRDIKGYHALRSQRGMKAGEEWESMPYIVAVLDELADLMAARGKEMEGLVVRLAQMARAVGIHLVLATQRPSVEVITGTIKANITSRMAFQVASHIDSRTILDTAGAERLLGQGDMLFVSSEFTKPRRVQGAFVSEKEVKQVVEWIANETKDFEREDIAEDDLAQSATQGLDISSGDGSGDDDPMYEEAKRVVLETRKASSSLLQRRLKLGYARAARLIDLLEERGVIGPGEGAKPREVFGAGSSEFQEGDEGESEWQAPRL